MVQFLIDVNLPYYFKLWNSENYLHQREINDEAKDTEIWNYAKKHQLTIVTKDSDFSNRILLDEPPPKVIHIKLGNCKMNEFYKIINKVWNDVLELNSTHKLVNVFSQRIEGIK